MNSMMNPNCQDINQLVRRKFAGKRQVGDTDTKWEATHTMSRKRPRTPIRVPTAKPTRWHKDKSKYDRKKDRLKIRKEKYNDL